MEEIIIKYIERNYRFIMTQSGFFVFNMCTDIPIDRSEWAEQLDEVFGEMVTDELFDIIGTWFDSQMTGIQNKIVDLQYQKFEELKKAYQSLQ